MSIRLGIMQGRLLPPLPGRIQAFPKDRWQEEFPLARELGFDAIEFVLDMDGADIEGHPLLEPGCLEIRHLVERYGVRVATVCGDYFMRYPFHAEQPQESLELLRRLVGNSPFLGLTDIVVPCVDESRLKDVRDRRRFSDVLDSALPLCEQAGVRLALETDLPPAIFRELLDDFGSPCVTVNYDVGNSASLGYDSVEEWKAYGDKISSVHVKDRLLGGPTVPLGSGSARFEDFFGAARSAGYNGMFVIQGARGLDDVATARRYKEFVERYLQRFYG